MSTRTASSNAERILTAAVPVAGCLAAAWAGTWFVDVASGAILVWPLSGLALGLLLRVSQPDWWWVSGVIGVAGSVAHLAVGLPAPLALGLGGMGVLEAVLAARLLNWAAGGPFRLVRLAHVAALVSLAVVSVNAVTAAVSAGLVAAIQGADFLTTWGQRWLASGAGILIFAPTVIAWDEELAALRQMRRRSLVEGLLLVGSAVVLSALILGGSPSAPALGALPPLALPYVVVPLLVWAGLRFDTWVASLAGTLVALTAVTRTLDVMGLFPPGQLSGEPMAFLHGFVAVAVLSALVPAVAMAERRRAEEERRALDILLANLLDKTPVAVSITGADGRLRMVNRGWERMTGRSHGEAVGRLLEEVVPAAPAAGVAASVREVLSSGGVVEQEETVVDRDGHHRVLQTVRFPVRDAAEVVEAVGAISLDITARKNAEDQIIRVNRLYAVLTQTNEAIARVTEQQALLEEVCRIVVQAGGFALAWVGQVAESNARVVPVASAGDVSYLDGFAVPLDGSLDDWGPVVKAVTEEKVAVWNDVQSRGSGSGWQDRALAAGFRAVAAAPVVVEGRRPLVLALYSVEAGSFQPAETQMLGELGLDIGRALEVMGRESARCAAEAESARAELRFRTVFEQANDAILLIDVNGERRLVDATPAAERLFGLPRDLLLRLGPRELSPERQPDGRASADLVAERLAAATEGGRQYFEWTLRRCDGQLRQAEVGLSPVDGRGVVTAVVRDITERRALEDQLRQAQKMEAVGRLAGGVAHDFNNLLTVIKGYTELALGESAAGAPRHEALVQVQKAAERASALTRQLLAFSRKQILEPAILDINTVVGETDKMLRRLIGEDIELLTVLTHGLWPVHADRGQIEQVLLNLAINARDAMPSGGRLTIETANRELDAEYVRAHPEAREGPHVVLAVTDNGTGIEPEVQAHLFEPFFTTKARGRGTGLGLSTVYGIVRQSGGHVTFSSEVGVGTKFEVFLPATARQAVRPTPAGSASKFPVGSETVLLAEDDPAVRTLTFALLTRWGYVVLQAAGGPEALALSRERTGPIHLLLTDVVMPRLGGRELATTLCKERPGLKVLFMSGYSEDPSEERGAFDPSFRLLQKPFTPESLARTVREALDG